MRTAILLSTSTSLLLLLLLLSQSTTTTVESFVVWDTAGSATTTTTTRTKAPPPSFQTQQQPQQQRRSKWQRRAFAVPDPTTTQGDEHLDDLVDSDQQSLTLSSSSSSSSSSPIPQQRLILHSIVCHRDPDWYQEYVVDIFGDDFCSQTWPIISSTELPPSPPPPSKQQPIATTDKETEKATSLTASIVAPSNLGTPSQSTGDTISKSSLQPAKDPAKESAAAKANHPPSSPTLTKKATAKTKTIPNTVEWKLAAKKDDDDDDKKTASVATTTTSSDNNSPTGPTVKNVRTDDSKVESTSKDDDDDKEDPTAVAVTMEKCDTEPPNDIHHQGNKSILPSEPSTLLENPRVVVQPVVDRQQPKIENEPDMTLEDPPLVQLQQTVRMKESAAGGNVTVTGKNDMTFTTTKREDEGALKLEDPRLVQPVVVVAAATQPPPPIEMKDVETLKKTTNTSNTTSPAAIGDEETTLKATTNLTSTSSKTTNTTATITSPTSSSDDQRVVLYRTIVGNTMTFVPLQNLTILGYSIPELQRMQSDSLCVVINDHIRNPRMGVPLQWCIQDKRAPPQVQVVDTMETAERLIEEDAALQQEEKRRVRTTKAIPKDAEKPKGDSSTDKKSARKGKQQPRPVRVAARSKERLDVLSSKGSSWRNSDADEEDEEDDDNQRKRQGTDTPRKPLGDRAARKGSRDGSIKRIYNARDPYGGSMQRKKVDRGDPPVPTKGPWMDYDTFKDLLRKEAELRVRIVGEQFAPTIKQESQWRLELYKAWLWNLHDGIGESFVPPSRYERARRMRRSGGIYQSEEVKATPNSGKARKKQGAPESRDKRQRSSPRR